VAAQSTKNGVGVAVRCSQSESYKVELTCRNGTDRGAVVFIVSGREKLHGVNRNCHSSGQRPSVRRS
jgi:hypothetical protein